MRLIYAVENIFIQLKEMMKVLKEIRDLLNKNAPSEHSVKIEQNEEEHSHD